MSTIVQQTLAEITARKTAAEDLHGRVFAQCCNLILAAPGGADLVKTWNETFKALLRLNREEMEMVANGKLQERKLNEQL